MWDNQLLPDASYTGWHVDFGTECKGMLNGSRVASYGIASNRKNSERAAALGISIAYRVFKPAAIHSTWPGGLVFEMLVEQARHAAAQFRAGPPLCGSVLRSILKHRSRSPRLRSRSDVPQCSSKCPGGACLADHVPLRSTVCTKNRQDFTGSRKNKNTYCNIL